MVRIPIIVLSLVLGSSEFLLFYPVLKLDFDTQPAGMPA
jgi:hypothetical protein